MVCLSCQSCRVVSRHKRGYAERDGQLPQPVSGSQRLQSKEYAQCPVRACISCNVQTVGLSAESKGIDHGLKIPHVGYGNAGCPLAEKKDDPVNNDFFGYDNLVDLSTNTKKGVHRMNALLTYHHTALNRQSPSGHVSRHPASASYDQVAA